MVCTLRYFTYSNYLAILRTAGRTERPGRGGENEMTGYTIALFLHVLGALGMFVALAFEWVAWAGLRRSGTVQEARGWLGLLGLVRRVGPASLGLILVAGLYMTATVVGWTAWILVGLASFVVIAALGGISNGRSLPAIERALQTDTGPISDALRQSMSAPILAASVRVRTALALGIVFLMTTKPDVVGALVVIAVAAAVGAVASRVGMPPRLAERAARAGRP